MKSIYNYLIDVSFEKLELIDDSLVLQEYLVNIANELGFNAIGKQSHKFKPVGVTSLILLSESHISIHTWPEYCFGAIDILTCSGRINKTKMIELISNDSLGIIVERWSEIKRDVSFKVSV